MVNALQRHAAIVVQKSLREGFGLTVAEAMWKGKPVVASAVGGIQDQIEHGVSGWLLPDPTDQGALAAALWTLAPLAQKSWPTASAARPDIGRALPSVSPCVSPAWTRTSGA